MILKINDRFKNRKIDFFNNFQMQLKHDSIGSTFEVAAYFDPQNEGHKEAFCVGHYHDVTLEENGEIILKGYALSQAFSVGTVKQMAKISGYSYPGVLEDCTIPPQLYPLQSDGLSLIQICQRLIKPFKQLQLEVDPAVQVRASKALKTSTASQSQTIKQYLTELAKQKNIILSHTLDGKLLLTESKTSGTPILDFDLTVPNGGKPGLSFDLVFDGQQMHSDITVQRQASIDGGNAGSYTIENPYVPIVYRPTTTSQTSGDDNDSSLGARRALANELRALTLKIELDRWAINGVLIKPNNTITIKAPELYLFEKTTWFIESVSVVGDEKQQTTTLNCVLPEVYTNEIPKSFWDGYNLYPKPHV
jgi:prophage tail gpP-like protein